MKDIKQIKIGLNEILGLILGIIIFIAILVGISVNNKINDDQEILPTNTNNIRKVNINDKNSNKNTWVGEFHQDIFNVSEEIAPIREVVSYKKYLEIIKSIKSKTTEDIKAYYSSKDRNYIILAYADGHNTCKLDLAERLEANDGIVISGIESKTSTSEGATGYLIVIPTYQPVGTEVVYREYYTNPQDNNSEQYK